MAQDHRDGVEGDVEFFGDDLGERRADPRAEVDVAVVGRDPAAVVDA